MRVRELFDGQNVRRTDRCPLLAHMRCCCALRMPPLVVADAQHGSIGQLLTSSTFIRGAVHMLTPLVVTARWR